MKQINPSLPKIRFKYKGRGIEIPYYYPEYGLQRIFILDKYGDEHVFYKGMYVPGEWHGKDTEKWEKEFKDILFSEFEKLSPKDDTRKEGKRMWEYKSWWEI